MVAACRNPGRDILDIFKIFEIPETLTFQKSSDCIVNYKKQFLKKPFQSKSFYFKINCT